MRCISSILLAGSVAVAATIGWPASAASVFSANATAGITLSTDSAGGLEDLSYLGSRVTYNAAAQASFDVGVIVDLDDGMVVKSGAGDSFATLFSGGQTMSDLLFKPVSTPIAFGAVAAASDEAQSFGDGAFADDASEVDLSADVGGAAFDTGDAAFANAVVRWSIIVDFGNLASTPLIATWTVEHVLSAAASADPRGTAFAQSTFSGTGAEDVANAAADPEIPPSADNPDGVKPTPPTLSGTTRFNFLLDPGETKTFAFALEARGNATIVPAPAAGLLLFTGVVVLGAVTGGRGRKMSRQR